MLKEIEIKNEAQVEQMLDARSLLGLFALVGRKAQVVVEDDVAPRAFDKLVAKMA